MAVHILRDDHVVNMLASALRRLNTLHEHKENFSEIIKSHFANNDDFQESEITRFSFLKRDTKLIFEATFVTPDGKTNFVNVTFFYAPAPAGTVLGSEIGGFNVSDGNGGSNFVPSCQMP